jgi:hypothetical protein
MLTAKNRLVVYGSNAIQKSKELGVKPLAEIPEDVDDVEKIVLLKSVLENPDKKKVTIADKIKSKVLKFGSKLKKGY